MATVSHSSRVRQPVGVVWAVVREPASVAEWFPGVQSADVANGVRTVVLDSGQVLYEAVTVDDALRRLQYRLTGGMRLPDLHVASIEVVDEAPWTRIVYGTEVLPDLLAPRYDQGIAVGLAGLVAHLSCS